MDSRREILAIINNDICEYYAAVTAIYRATPVDNGCGSRPMIICNLIPTLSFLIICDWGMLDTTKSFKVKHSLT